MDWSHDRGSKLRVIYQFVVSILLKRVCIPQNLNKSGTS